MKKTIFSLALMIALGFSANLNTAYAGEVGHGSYQCVATETDPCPPPSEDGEVGHGSRSAYADQTSSSTNTTDFLSFLEAYFGF